MYNNPGFNKRDGQKRGKKIIASTHTEDVYVWNAILTLASGTGGSVARGKDIQLRFARF